jgi:hypothetical protein
MRVLSGIEGVGEKRIDGKSRSKRELGDSAELEIEVNQHSDTASQPTTEFQIRLKSFTRQNLIPLAVNDLPSPKSPGGSELGSSPKSHQ